MAKPISSLYPDVIQEIKFGNANGFLAGISADLKIIKSDPGRLMINTGLQFMKNEIPLNIHYYHFSYRQSYNECLPTAYECSIFDRSSLISENLTLYNLSLPILLKYYCFRSAKKNSQFAKIENMSELQKTKGTNPVFFNFYIKTGIKLSFLYAKSSMNYQLSHTAGGKFIYTNPDSLGRWFYLDEQHELSNEPEYYKNKNYNYSSSVSTNPFFLSLSFGLGLEIEIDKWFIGIEPWLDLGATNISKSTNASEFKLYPDGQITSFIQSFNSPKLNTFGIKIIAGRLFMNKF
jgi:hypothetical protein